MAGNHAELLRLFDPYAVTNTEAPVSERTYNPNAGSNLYPPIRTPADKATERASSPIVTQSLPLPRAPPDKVTERANSPVVTQTTAPLPSRSESSRQSTNDVSFFELVRLTHTYDLRSDPEESRDNRSANRSLAFGDVPIDGNFFVRISVRILCLPDQPLFEFVEPIQRTVSDLICSVLKTIDDTFDSGMLSTGACFELRCAKTNEVLVGNGKLADYHVFTDALRFSLEPVLLMLAVGKASISGQMFEFQQKSDLTCQKALERSLRALDDQLKLLANPWRLQASSTPPRLVYQNTVSLIRDVETALNVQHCAVFRRLVSQFEKLAASVLQTQNLEEICRNAAKNIADFVNAYTDAFEVPFQIRLSSVSNADSSAVRPSQSSKGRLFLGLSSLHRFSQTEDTSVRPFFVECSVCDVDGLIVCEPPTVSYTFEHKILCSQPNCYAFVSNEDDCLPVAYLDRLTPASRMLIRLYSVLPMDSQSRSTASQQDRFGPVTLVTTNAAGHPQQRRMLVGWANIPIFERSDCLQSGIRVIPLWPGDIYNQAIEKSLCWCANKNDATCLLLVASFKADYPLKTKQPSVAKLPEFENATLPNMPSSVEERLFRVLYSDLGSLTDEDKSFFWSNRIYLKSEAMALPILLWSAPKDSPAAFNELVTFTADWPSLPGDPLSVLRLLLPSLTNPAVTEVLSAVLSRRVCSDRVIDMCLPQFVQSLRRHGWTLADALIRRVSENHELSVTLYFLLAYEANNCDFICCRKFYSSLSLFLRSRMTGTAFVEEITNQHFAVMTIMAMAEKIYNTKNSAKQIDLQRVLQGYINAQAKQELPKVFTFPCVGGSDTRLSGLDAPGCAVLSSRAAPLRLKFLPLDQVDTSSSPLMCIVKVGDDLRNDLVALQLVRIMDYIWMSCQLDLRVITFKVLPTDNRQGIIEFVPDVDQLRVAQGSLSKNSLIEWFTSRGADKQLDPAIVDTFTRTCAAWCVATYIIGVGDRHNDNILVNRTTGHLFHIDFGRLFGDAERIAGIRRDRVPFCFTDTMAAVISGGQEFGQDFAHAGYRQFVDTCCLAFNLVRRRGESMLLSAVKTLRFPSSCVRYLQDCLMLHLSDADASAAFEKMIEESLKSVAPQFNFFIHSIAQRFVQQPPALPQTSTYSKTPQGFEALNVPADSLVFAEVTEFYKIRFPVKHYLYQIAVYPELASNLTLTAGGGPLIIFRRFSEVVELRETLVTEFALLAQQIAIFKSKNYGENRDTAKRRQAEMNNFFQTLFSLTLEVRRLPAVSKFFKVRPMDLRSAAGMSRSSNTHLPALEQEGQLWMTVTLKQPEAPILEVFLHRGVNLFYDIRSDGNNVTGRARITLVVKDYRCSSPANSPTGSFSVDEINSGISKFRSDLVLPGSQPFFNKLFLWKLPPDVSTWPSELSLIVKVKMHPTNSSLTTNVAFSSSIDGASAATLCRTSSVKHIGTVRIPLTRMISWATSWPVVDSQYYKIA